ncbi:hypothetical protein [Couchioplanes azureus]|uniref:hypothetical protein n=1 Tax=Couchioplanes caeruleus TaxID=56438 RepID=UPI0019B7EF12|nr:hypothetical protein [Couchioplanes caeruleus]GGQ83774.1 hypothetical protein GCM10010166_62450 [Couchioplanes caeruleus subsp. azureus]
MAGVIVSLVAGTCFAGGCIPGAFDDGCGTGAKPALAASDEEGRPSRIAINHDDFDARYVGRLTDGRQFFLTTPFLPGKDGSDINQDFMAVYLFDRDGRFLEAKIDELNVPDSLDGAEVEQVYQARLKELGEVTFGRIEVEPFAVTRFGAEFGLIAQAPEDLDDIWWVTAEPGNYMAFAAPWDCGIYDT